LKAWEDEIQARELAEKRRVAPGWLDSDARILEPERVDGRGAAQRAAPASQVNLMDTDTSSAEISGLDQMQSAVNNGDELDRAFGGLGLR
jgi:hypothetical protein